MKPVSLLFFSAIFGACAENLCDPTIHPMNTNQPLSYKMREDRCEGLFLEPLAGQPLQLFSLTRGEIRFEDDTRKLKVSWPRIAGDHVNTYLRASSLRAAILYRMDTQAGSSIFGWSTDLIRQAGLESGQIGLMAWRPSSSSLTTYMPVTTESSKMGGSCVAIIIPATDVTELKIVVTPIGQQGISKPLKLPRTRFVAGQPIVLEINDACRPGIHRVLVTATAAPYGPASLAFNVASR